MAKYLSYAQVKLLTNGALTAEAQAEYFRSHYGIEPFIVNGRVYVYEEAAIRAQLTPKRDRSHIAVNNEVFGATAQK